MTRSKRASVPFHHKVRFLPNFQPPLWLSDNHWLIHPLTNESGPQLEGAPYYTLSSPHGFCLAPFTRPRPTHFSFHHWLGHVPLTLIDPKHYVTMYRLWYATLTMSYTSTNWALPHIKYQHIFKPSSYVNLPSLFSIALPTPSTWSCMRTTRSLSHTKRGKLLTDFVDCYAHISQPNPRVQFILLLRFVHTRIRFPHAHTLHLWWAF